MRLQTQRQTMVGQTLQYFAELGAFEDNEPQERLQEQRLAVG